MVICNIHKTNGMCVLYKVGRNLNRAYRTCEAFGVKTLCLVGCDPVLSGNLYKAKGRVKIVDIEDLPYNDNALALETIAKQIIAEVKWENVRTIVNGGETISLSKQYISHVNSAHII